ncbi:MAG: hypothetical protein V4560_09670 [Bacteroidota bacterium]
MKRSLIFIIILLFCGNSFAQQITERKNTITVHVTEQFQTVTENGKIIKSGIYHAFYRKKVIASGMYKNDKRVGTWLFYDPNGVLLQNFDYATNKITYEAPENAISRMRYIVDYQIGATDTVIQPVKLGGRYFGYLPYLKILRSMEELEDVDMAHCGVTVKFLISPYGRLADCSVHIECAGTAPAVLNINTDLLTEDDKLFAPATFNKKLVASQIEISCYRNDEGKIEIY